MMTFKKRLAKRFSETAQAIIPGCQCAVRRTGSCVHLVTDRISQKEKPDIIIFYR